MAFSEATKGEIFDKSGGRCQCTREHAGKSDAPHHGGRCSNTFTRYGSWEAHHKTAVSSDGADYASNGEALCTKCHKLTQTYGVG